MAAGAGDIRAELGLGISQFLDAVNRVEQKLANVKTKTEGMDTAIGKGLSGIGVALAATIGASVAAITAAAAGLKDAFDLGGHVSDIAAQMGASAGKAYILQAAFENAGLGAEDAVKGVEKMHKALVEASNGGGSAGLFNALKLDPKQLMQMDPTEAFTKIGAAIGEIENPSIRAAASMELFGKSGAKMQTLFGDKGAIAFATEQLGHQADILDKSATDFDTISDTLGGTWKKLQGFFVGMGGRLVDQLKPVFAEFNKLDLAGIGEQFGQAIADGIDYFRAVWQSLDIVSAANLLSNAYMLALKEVANFYWAAMWGGLRAWGMGVQEYVKSWVTLFGIVTTADFWKGMGNALLGIGAQFNALLIRGIATVLHEVSKIPGLGGLGKVENPLRVMADLEQQSANDFFSKAGNNLAPAFDAITKRATEAAHNVWDAFKTGFGQTDKLFNTDEEKAAIEAITGKIAAAYADIRRTAKDAAKDAAPGGARDNLKISPESSLPGTFAQAVNFLMGRSIYELQLEEAKSQTAQLVEMNSTLQEISKNTANKKPPVIKVDGTPRFN